MIKLIMRMDTAKRFTCDNMGVRVRMNGSVDKDWRFYRAASEVEEPDWSTLRWKQLLAAEKMCLHRISGGEASWRPILKRIRQAKRLVQPKRDRRKKK